MELVVEKYKQTEVGLIPIDWKVKTIGEIADIATGTTPPTNDKNNYGEEYFFASPADLGKGKYIIDTEKKLSKLGFSISRKYPANSILFTCIGSTIGKSGISQIEMTSNQQINAVFPNDIYSSDFVFYYLNFISPKIKLGASEQAVPMINKTEFAKTIIAYPTKFEQTLIATALSDTDALISSLSTLIAKKRNIKQGAMQKLLQPKEGWLVKKLGEIAEISGGYSATREQLSDDGFCYLHYGDIHGATKTYIDTKSEFLTIPKLPIELKKISRNSLLENGDIVFVDASEDDEGVSRHVVIVNEKNIPFISGLHTIVVKIREDVLVNGYKRFCFQTRQIKDQFKFYAVGTKVSGISKSNIKNIKIFLPTVDEQNNIATILSDIDNEITALETKLEKYKKIKLGMMQTLLTGKIRLV